MINNHIEDFMSHIIQSILFYNLIDLLDWNFLKIYFYKNENNQYYFII